MSRGNSFFVCFVVSVMLVLSFSGIVRADGSAAVSPGDRILSENGKMSDMGLTAYSPDKYRLGPGDVLSVNVQGRSAYNFFATSQSSDNTDHAQVTVSATGSVYLPLVGNIDANGNTISQLESLIRTSLSKYLKHFTVSVSLASPRSLFVWVGGEVSNAGLQSLPGVATAAVSAMRAGILSTGSVRRVELIRGNTHKIIDLYRIMVLGDIDGDSQLQPGDRIYVPTVTRYAEITGDVIRAGRYEMVSLTGDMKSFCIGDLLGLAMGPTPSAALNKAFIERIGVDGKKVAINVDLSGGLGSPAYKTTLMPGDILVVPSVASFQPMVRMIGEFKGDGVYQRVMTTDSAGDKEAKIENKSGIYFLKQGQTVGDVIIATGGVTPQADLRKARIERVENGVKKTIPVDLERLLVKGDKSADVKLVNGDTLVLPAVADKVYVFGEVHTPGVYDFSPSQRLVDYIGDAGGPTERSMLTSVRIIRGTAESPEFQKVDLSKAMKSVSVVNDPVLEAGDIVFVPSKAIAGWRDGLQLIFTSLSLKSLLGF